MKLHGNLNYIGFYVAQVEHSYHKIYTVKNGWGDYVRPVAMYIVYKFTGVRMKAIARYFKCSTAAVSLAISRQIDYEQTKDEKFLHHYNQLLDLYIKTTNFYIRKNKFISL